MRPFLTISFVLSLLLIISCNSGKTPKLSKIYNKNFISRSRIMLQDGTLLADSAQKLISFVQQLCRKISGRQFVHRIPFNAIDISLNMPQPQKS